jgi:hypothetical protein
MQFRESRPLETDSDLQFKHGRVDAELWPIYTNRMYISYKKVT